MAAAIYLDLELLGTRETRRRVIESWVDGAAVYQLDDGLLLRFVSPCEVTTERSLGVPLVELQGRLVAAPLRAEELSATGARSSDVVLIRHGVSCVHALTSPLDPSRWIDVGDVDVVDTEDLAELPDDIDVVLKPTPFDPRAKLDVGKAAGLDTVVRSLKMRSGVGLGPGGSVAGEDRVAGGGLLTGLLSGLAMLGVWIRGWFGRETDREADAPHKPHDSGRSLGERLQSLLSRLAISFRLGGLFGRRQAEYLANMMQMFDDGDLMEALRHAIPLSDLHDAGLGDTALGLPSRREHLQLNLGAPAGGGTIHVGLGFEAMMRERYRAAYQRLERLGRIDEAVFVLTELLRDHHEAVALLERHGRLVTAAELAEARELEPSLVVRLWFLAGRRERAVQFALVKGAFADAIVRLERTDREAADALRVVWAERLAEAGDYAAAVEAIWQLEAERRRAAQWIERGVTVGGVLGAKMLARQVHLCPSAFADSRALVLDLLDMESSQAVSARAAFIDELCRDAPSDTGAPTLARAAARALLRDGDAGRAKQAATYAGAPELRADLASPTLRLSERLADRDRPLEAKIEHGDRGGTPIRDVAFLPGGNLLCAHGELGMRIYGRRGQTLVGFEHPADQLIVSHQGTRAIGVARRGEVVRLSRIDLVDRRARDWCDARVDRFATSYDGSLWIVSDRDALLAIDATATDLSAVWRLDGFAGGIRDIAVHASSLSVLTGQFELYRYELPGFTLRQRRAVEIGPDENLSLAGLSQLQVLALRPDGAVLSAWVPSSTEAVEATGSIGWIGTARIAFPMQSTLVAVAAMGRFATVIELPDDEQVETVAHLLTAEDFVSRARLTVEGGVEGVSRLSDSHLVIADELGRAWVLDLETGEVLRNLRV